MISAIWDENAMGRSKSDKQSTSDTHEKKKKKKRRSKRSKDSDDSDDSTSTEAASTPHQELTEVEKAIIELRSRGKEDPNIDFVGELRKIQDNISDLKGEDRRPITAVSYSRDGDDGDDDEEEDDEEEEEEEEELKDMINRRLTTCMMLALSFENEDDYPKDFYEKLAESEKFKEVTQPFGKSEIRKLNKLIKEKKKDAYKRMDECK